VRRCQREAEAEGQIAKKQVSDHVQLGHDISKYIKDFRAFYETSGESLTAQTERCKDLEAKNQTLEEEAMELRHTNQQLTSEVEELRAESEQEALAKKEADERIRSQRPMERSEAQSILEGCLHKNIAWEMKVAESGLRFEKVLDKHPRRETRTVALCPDPAEDVHLKWQKPNSKWTKLPLKDVMRIDYGCATKASVMYKADKDVVPWLCFSLYTKDRSYDFLRLDEDSVGKDLKRQCPSKHELKFLEDDTSKWSCNRCNQHKVSDWKVHGSDVWRCDTCSYNLCSRCASMRPEDAVRCFVLAISRLIPHVAGAVPSRSKFQQLKGWCKVQDYCHRHGMTLATAVKQAIREASRPEGSLSPQRSPSRMLSAKE